MCCIAGVLSVRYIVKAFYVSSFPGNSVLYCHGSLAVCSLAGLLPRVLLTGRCPCALSPRPFSYAFCLSWLLCVFLTGFFRSASLRSFFKCLISQVLFACGLSPGLFPALFSRDFSVRYFADNFILQQMFVNFFLPYFAGVFSVCSFHGDVTLCSLARAFYFSFFLEFFFCTISQVPFPCAFMLFMHHVFFRRGFFCEQIFWGFYCGLVCRGCLRALLGRGLFAHFPKIFSAHFFAESFPMSAIRWSCSRHCCATWVFVPCFARAFSGS